MADFQVTAIMALPAAYILLPAAMMVVWFIATGKNQSALFSCLKILTNPVEGELVESKPIPEPSMGEIIPLVNLNWKTEEPRKIYKFNPKYFLTMGILRSSLELTLYTLTFRQDFKTQISTSLHMWTASTRNVAKLAMKSYGHIRMLWHVDLELKEWLTNYTHIL